MLLSIIISTKNTSADILAHTLESFKSIQLEDTEIIIVDQNSDERMRSVVEEYSSKFATGVLQYVPSSQSGLSRGRNRGYKASSGGWLLFFDDDAFVSEETMKALYARLKQDQTISEVLYGRVLTIEHKRNYLSRAITSSRLHYINFDSICSIGLVFNRQVIEQVGLFDEQFGVGSRFGAGEESDLILRVLEHAVPIYFMPEFIVYHPQAIPDIQKAFRYGEGLGAVYKKHSTVNFTIKFVLLLRWCAEWMIRIGLIFFAFIRGRKQVVQFHRQYLQGFYQGFKTYENS